ncbi:hypothetical protein ABK040_002306 [Willaertia magna]
MSRTIIVSLSFICLLLVTNIICFTCPAGYFDTGNYEHPCSSCSVGRYCPGDGKAYDCSNGTIAPNQGMVACTQCESKRTNIYKTVCILVNTPTEAREAIDDKFDVISVKNPYWFTTLLFTEYLAEAPSKLLQYTFVDQKLKRDTPVVVYASTVTGKPSKDNYMYMAIGQNATINIPNSKQSQPIVMYFSIVPLEVDSAQFVGKSWLWLSKTYQFTTSTFAIENTGSDLAQYVNTEALFVYHSVPANSKVNFTISVEDNFTHENVKYKLYYSTLKNIDYPTMNNANIVVESPFKKISTTSLVTNNAKEGPFAVSMVIPTTYYARIKVSVNVSQ